MPMLMLKNKSILLAEIFCVELYRVRTCEPILGVELREAYGR